MAALVLAGSGMHAGVLTVNIILTQPFANANPGDIVPFDATVSAPLTNSGPVYLNADTYNIDNPLSLDDSPFGGFPLFLNPGDAPEQTLFDVIVPAGTPDGLYTGYFEIDGGAGGDVNIYDAYLGSATFNVQVSESASVPEPSTLVLLAAGLTLLALGRRKSA